MKVGVFMALFNQKSLGEALDYVQKTGLEAVEVSTGNYPGDAHCKIDELLNSKEAGKKKSFLTGKKRQNLLKKRE